MANPHYSDANPNHGKMKQRDATGVKPKKAGTKGDLTMKTANWPGLPGKSGPNRSAGIKKLKIHTQSKGL